MKFGNAGISNYTSKIQVARCSWHCIPLYFEDSYKNYSAAATEISDQMLIPYNKHAGRCQKTKLSSLEKF